MSSSVLSVSHSCHVPLLDAGSVRGTPARVCVCVCVCQCWVSQTRLSDCTVALSLTLSGRPDRQVTLPPLHAPLPACPCRSPGHPCRPRRVDRSNERGQPASDRGPGDSVFTPCWCMVRCRIVCLSGRSKHQEIDRFNISSSQAILTFLPRGGKKSSSSGEKFPQEDLDRSTPVRTRRTSTRPKPRSRYFIYTYRTPPLSLVSCPFSTRRVITLCCRAISPLRTPPGPRLSFSPLQCYCSRKAVTALSYRDF